MHFLVAPFRGSDVRPQEREDRNVFVRRGSYVIGAVVALICILGGASPAEAGAIRTDYARPYYPGNGIVSYSGGGIFFLGYQESVIKVEALFLMSDGSVLTVPAGYSTSNMRWSGSLTRGSYPWVKAVKGRITFRDKYGRTQVYTEAAWYYY